MGIQTVESKSGEAVTVSVSGRFDYRDYDSFKESFPAVEKSSQVTVDLSEAEYIDSSALGMLLVLRERAVRAADVLLIAPTPDVARILSIANFDKLFAIQN